MKYDDAIKAANLTERQTTILNLWLNNHSLRRIALALGISEATARGHLDAALRKLKPHMPQQPRQRKEAA